MKYSMTWGLNKMADIADNIFEFIFMNDDV